MKERKPLAVGDRVRLRGYSYAGKVVEGCVGTVTELRNPDELDVEVQVTDLGKVLVYPSQCRRLVRKPKERVWTAQAIKRRSPLLTEPLTAGAKWPKPWASPMNDKDAEFIAEVRERARDVEGQGPYSELLRRCIAKEPLEGIDMVYLHFLSHASVDIPRLLAMIADRDEKLRVAQEECDKWRQEYQDLCPITTSWERRTTIAISALEYYAGNFDGTDGTHWTKDGRIFEQTKFGTTQEASPKPARNALAKIRGSDDKA